jgi:hypothetical protein
MWWKIALVLTIATLPALAWDGSDSETGESVSIEQGNLVRTDEDIQILDEADGEHHDVNVASITRYGSTVELEVYDYDTGEYRTLEMED